MDEEVKKKKKRVKRLVLAVSMCLVSISIGIVSGVQISKIAHNDLPNNPGKPSIISPLDELTAILKNNWYSDIYYGEDYDANRIINQFIGAMKTDDKVLLDPYTFLIKNEDSNVPIIQSGKLGITIGFYYHHPVVIDVNENSDAFGTIKKGDIIVKTGRQIPGGYEYYDITDPAISYSSILQLACGKPGNNIYIEAARFDESNKISYVSNEFKLKNGFFTPYSYIEEENLNDTVMVKLEKFVDTPSGSNTYNDLKLALKGDTSKNIILDLRNNGGGSLSSVVNVCDLFLPANKLVTTLQYKDGSFREYYTQDDFMYDYDNIVIFQNDHTASASEILISTLQFYYPDKVKLVGTKSYGKGIAQIKQRVLNGEYYLQYTCAKWLRPDGSWIGMRESAYTDKEGYQLGFEPTDGCLINMDKTLSVMEANNSTLIYKDTPVYQGFIEDKIYFTNKLFFEIYNEMFEKDIRTDGYYDANCKQALIDYQTLRGIEEKGEMNEETFLYFIHDFYEARKAYENEFLVKTKNAIGV